MVVLLFSGLVFRLALVQDCGLSAGVRRAGWLTFARSRLVRDACSPAWHANYSLCWSSSLSSSLSSLIDYLCVARPLLRSRPGSSSRRSMPWPCWRLPEPRRRVDHHQQGFFLAATSTYMKHICTMASWRTLYSRRTGSTSGGTAQCGRCPRLRLLNRTRPRPCTASIRSTRPS